MKRAISLFLGLLVSMAAASQGFDRVSGKPFASRSEVIATHGMVATSQPLATQVALDVLKAGGSAVDAAIAANATLGLMEPTGCGIGGDLFAIVWDAQKGELTGLNASGRSPESLTLQHFRDVLSDPKFAKVLEIRESLKEKDPLYELIGVLHFVDRLSMLIIGELRQAPVFEHAGVQEVLVDCCELVLQHFVQVFDDGGVAFHDFSPVDRFLSIFAIVKKKPRDAGLFGSYLDLNLREGGSVEYWLRDCRLPV